MGKFKYSRAPLKGLSISPFLNEAKIRTKHINEAPDTPPVSMFNANRLAESLHPGIQYATIIRVIERGTAKSYILAADKTHGTRKLAYFRAGQFISVAVNINGNTIFKPYTICSSPVDALGRDNRKSTYTITVKKAVPGFVSKAIIETWKPGTKIMLSDPHGSFYYTSLRDAKHVIAAAGGSGIAPFVSMAAAIADGVEDFRLTILYGNKYTENVLFTKELKDIEERSCGKVKVINVISDDYTSNAEHGFITPELIKKYAGDDDYSLFVCGPQAMYSFLERETVTLGIPKRRIRFEVSGEIKDITQDPGFTADPAKIYFVTVNVHEKKYKITCKATQTLLSAMESVGITVPANCRSGDCGWCHSRLLSGEVFIPQVRDKRRMADSKFNHIHPCVAYPLSDVEISVSPML